MSRLASLMFAGAATVALLGCAAEDQSSRESFARGDNNLDMDGCVKIEGADIGLDGVTVTLGGLSVEFTSWLAKDGEPAEFVGFTLSGSAVFFIKAGNNADTLFEGSGTSWVNPNGTGGSAVKGISNIQICEITPPPPPPEECGSDANPCPPPPPPEPCGSDANPCPPPPPPPPPEECGSVSNPCPPPPPPPPPEQCGSVSNPCPPPPPPPPPEQCGSLSNPCPPPPPPPPPEQCGSVSYPCPPPPPPPCN